jgi:hypothetical protein
MLNEAQETKKWGAVLDHESAPAIQDNYRRSVTAKLLENTEKAIKETNSQVSGGVLSEAVQSGGNGTAAGLGQVGSTHGFDPILISMVRRAMPNLIAYDVAGVQPLSAPTGLIFALKARSENIDNADSVAGGAGGDATKDGGPNSSPAQPEILFNEADTGFSSGATGPFSGDGSPFDNTLANAGTYGTTSSTYDPITGMSLSDAQGGSKFNSAGFSIEKTSVEAVTRQLKADYTMELAQDLKAVHGLDAESELANILSTEILAEINREVIRQINFNAKIGTSNISATEGKFDLKTQADGRWAVEKFKSLIMQLEIEANQIAKETRRGKGNILITSSNVASALAATGSLDYSNAIAANLNVDDTGNTFAGVLNGRIKVYVDPYANVDYATVGYKGTNPFDAGIFYCPYVPLTMVRAIDEDTFQPKMAFKTRYGIVKNPFVSSETSDAGGKTAGNQYYRKFRVLNINSGHGSQVSSS